MVVATSHPSGVVGLAFVVACLLAQASISYSLTSSQCKEVVKSIGKISKTERAKVAAIKGIWVSPRCEVRRIPNAKGTGEKPAFLLRNIEIFPRKKWVGIYFFYRDDDCKEPVYGLKMQGQFTTRKNTGITFNFTRVKIAMYRKDVDTLKSFNRSCPDNTKLSSKNTGIYRLGSTAQAQRECLKAIGLYPDEFSEAFFQTHLINNVKTEEFIQKYKDLRKQHPSAPISRQWPLWRFKTSKCLTCLKVGFGNLKTPPKLYTRNASSVDGIWGTPHCRMESSGLYTSRFLKFVGNTFESSVFALDGPKCQKAKYELRRTGTLREVGDSAEVPGGAVYEVMIKKAFLTPYSTPMTTFFNFNPGKCGKEKWEVGKTQDVMVTKGCPIIGYTAGPPELVLIRAVRDEDRRELYFGMQGFNDIGAGKGGPLDYDIVSRDCSNFPIVIPTIPPTERVTTTPFASPTTDEIHQSVKTDLVLGLVFGKTTSASGPALAGVTKWIILCFLAFLQALRLA